MSRWIDRSGETGKLYLNSETKRELTYRRCQRKLREYRNYFTVSAVFCYYDLLWLYKYRNTQGKFVAAPENVSDLCVDINRHSFQFRDGTELKIISNLKE